MLRATFELQPAGALDVLPLPGGQVVSSEEGVVVLDLPEDNWGALVGLLFSALVAGEVTEIGRLTRAGWSISSYCPNLTGPLSSLVRRAGMGSTWGPPGCSSTPSARAWADWSSCGRRP